MNQFLKKMDMLSPHITLYYKKKRIHPSAISGFLSLIVYTFILTIGLIYFIRFINKENQTPYFFNRFVKDVGNYSLADGNFFNYVQLVQNRPREIIEIDFDKIEIIGYNISLDRILNAGYYRFDHWIYGKCDREEDSKEFGNIIDKEAFDKSACLKKFYNSNKSQYYDINDENFEWPVIEHGASDPNFTFYGVIIRRCQNSTFRLKHFGKCSSEEEIKDYLSSVFLNFNILDHYVDILNYKNPISTFLYPISNSISSGSYLKNSLNFNPGLIKSYDDLIREKSVEQTTYIFHENVQKTSPSESVLSIFTFYLQNSQQFYERHYKKLQDVFAEIGGFGSVVVMIARFINFIVSRFSMLYDTQQLISQALKDNKTIHEKKRKSDPVMRPFKLDDINKKREEIKHIRLYNSERNVKKVMNTELSEEGKEECNNIITKRINVINNNLGEETLRINKNMDNSRQNIIQIPNKEVFKRMKTRNIQKSIKSNISKIKLEEKFNCFNYLFYIIFCKKINIHIKFYEDLRRLIISEEVMFQNYLNIYKLLELHNVK